MNKSETNFLSILYTASLAFYFIFNFFDRSIGNIFLLITLLLCFLDYKNLYLTLKANSKLVISIILFSFYISFIGFYHNSPIRELDNYYRFLLLLPLLVISLNEPRMILLILICAITGLTHAIYNDAYYGIHLYPENVYRYQGTSNTAITYSNMCATFFTICLYYIFYKNNKSLTVILSAFIFLFLFMLTETRGPIIGILIVFFYLAYAIKSSSKHKINFKLPLITMFVFLLSIFTIPNPIGENLKNIIKTDFSNPLVIENKSIRSRALFLDFGAGEVKNNYLMGVGPQNIRSMLSEYLITNKVKDVESVDHVHNEFLDIVLKYGIFSLVLLFFIYFYLINGKNNENRVLLNLLLIMLVSSQLTQSQLAHHQAITFFIVLLYLFQDKKAF